MKANAAKDASDHPAIAAETLSGTECKRLHQIPMMVSGIMSMCWRHEKKMLVRLESNVNLLPSR